MLKFNEIVFVAIGLIATWIVVSFLISNVGGWGKLAKKYPCAVACEGRSFYCVSGRIGIADYGLCLILKVCKEGLRISVLFPFRVAHPPLLIPWEEMHNAFVKRLLWFDYVDLYVGSPIVSSLSLPAWVMQYMPESDSQCEDA